VSWAIVTIPVPCISHPNLIEDGIGALAVPNNAAAEEVSHCRFLDFRPW